MRSYPLVWVHLGQKRIPKYLKTSLKNHARVFPNESLVLLVDNEVNLINFGIPNLKVERVSVIDPKWESLKQSLDHDLSFRHEFWFSSLARFRFLYEYMRKNNTNRILHIESDVVVLPNFPFNDLYKLESKLGYLIQGHGQCIASLFYVGSRDILEEFLDFCIMQVTQNSRSTDMTILFNFAVEHRDKVSFFPTLLESRHGKFLEVSGFQGVFDAISVGQYLFGIDPRNFRGKRIVFKESENHYVKPSNYRFEWHENTLIAIGKSRSIELFSLHIHSKDVRLFRLSGLKKQLVSRNQESKYGETSEIIVLEVLKSIGIALGRRIRRSCLW